MDYQKIKLANERNSHCTKRLNNLNTWNFFKVLYRDHLWRLFGFSFLMLICIAPAYVLSMVLQYRLSALESTLGLYDGLFMTTGAWSGAQQYFVTVSATLTQRYALLMAAGAILLSFLFSGGFAVIRDAFWTGKLSVLKSLGRGIKSGFLYALAVAVICAASGFGMFSFFNWAMAAMPTWLAIVLFVLLCIVALFALAYLMILCSVAVTYKQPLKDNLADSWRLLWLNIVPNLIHLVIALIPVGLYFLLSSGFLRPLYLVMMFMFGGMYFPLVWQTFMMRTFALFHPVEVNKKGKPKKAQG